jgi:hypothetical protein
VIIQDNEIYMAHGSPLYYGDLNHWELRRPTEPHFINVFSMIMHASNPCAGENATQLPWVVLDALWAHGREQGKTSRNIGWCEKCCVAYVGKQAAA